LSEDLEISKSLIYLCAALVISLSAELKKFAAGRPEEIIIFI